MIISLIQENLVKALQRVTHVAGKNSSLPILQNILFKVGENDVTLIATNLEIGVTTTLRGKVEEKGDITIPARLLTEYINLLPQERVDISTEDNKMKISCKNFKTTILGTTSDDFPLLPEFKGGVSVSMTAKELRAGIGSVLYAAAPDETRPEISGVLMQTGSGKITFTATDSYRLAERKEVLANGGKEKTRVIVPARAMQELVRLVNDEDGSVTIHIGEGQVQVTGEDFSFLTRVVEGQYPDYEQIIPKEHKTRAMISATELAKAVKGASLFAPSGINDIHLSFFPAKREIEVSASSGQVGENKITVAGDITGVENSIVFNWRYLQDGLDHVGGGDVTLDIINPTNPGVLRPKDNQNFTYLIMPIKQ